MRYIKTAVIETLCETCSKYAVVKYGAREILPAEERWARFENHYPRSVKILRQMGAVAITIAFRDLMFPLKK
ncbi:MAG: hypothetical protein WA836_11380 [Candidatus Binataceae bacterium]